MKISNLKFRIPVLLAIFLFACLPICPAQVPSLLTVTLTFTYPSASAWGVCSSTVKANCISGFNVYDTTTAKTLLGTLPNAPTTSGAQTWSGNINFASTPALGTHTVVATTAYLDMTGKAGESAASPPGTFQVQPGTPTVTSLSIQ